MQKIVDILFKVWIGFLGILILVIIFFVHPYPDQDLGVGLGSAFALVELFLIIIFSIVIKIVAIKSKSKAFLVPLFTITLILSYVLVQGAIEYVNYRIRWHQEGKRQERSSASENKTHKVDSRIAQVFISEEDKTVNNLSLNIYTISTEGSEALISLRELNTNVEEIINFTRVDREKIDGGKILASVRKNVDDEGFYSEITISFEKPVNLAKGKVYALVFERADPNANYYYLKHTLKQTGSHKLERDKSAYEYREEPPYKNAKPGPGWWYLSENLIFSFN